MATADQYERQLAAKRVQQTRSAALSAMIGSADTRERASVASSANISQAEASRRIQAQVDAQRAANGLRPVYGAPLSGSADRMAAQQAGRVYGVGDAAGQQITNTQTDIIRGSQGLAPVYGADEKMVIPAPLFTPAAGSGLAGWNPAGPIGTGKQKLTSTLQVPGTVTAADPSTAAVTASPATLGAVLSGFAAGRDMPGSTLGTETGAARDVKVSSPFLSKVFGPATAVASSRVFDPSKSYRKLKY